MRTFELACGQILGAELGIVTPLTTPKLRPNCEILSTPRENCATDSHCGPKVYLRERHKDKGIEREGTIRNVEERGEGKLQGGGGMQANVSEFKERSVLTL